MGSFHFISAVGVGTKQRQEKVSHLYHFLDNFGLPLTVLCHTTGKLVLLAKFWVMAMVVSRLRTTCHQPPEIQQANSSVGSGSGHSRCDINFMQHLTGSSEAARECLGDRLLNGLAPDPGGTRDLSVSGFTGVGLCLLVLGLSTAVLLLWGQNKCVLSSSKLVSSSASRRGRPD